MTNAKPEVEWFTFPNEYWREYGLLNLAGKWAVVRRREFLLVDYDVITDWVDDRKTAIGFLKLLKEN